MDFRILMFYSATQRLFESYPDNTLQRYERQTRLKSVRKVKQIPLQAWTVPEGSRRLKLTDFKTIGT